MATHASAIKRSKQAEKRRLTNAMVKSNVKTQVKGVVGQAAGLLDGDAQALLAFHAQRSCRRRAARA